MRLAPLFAAALTLTAASAVRFPAYADEKAAQGWDTLVQAERDFSRQSEEKGMKASFLANYADDVLTFPPSGAAVVGTSALKEKTADTGALTWRPIRAEIAASGDFGYTTGPYEFRRSLKDRQPAAQGNYVSVWKRNAAGVWQVIASFSNDCPPPQSGEAMKDKIEVYRAAAEKLPPAPPATFASKAEAALYAKASDSALSAEAAFGKLAKGKGYASAFAALAAPDVSLYRPGQRPLIGKVAPAALSTLGKVVEWKPAGVAAAASGDLAFTHGAAAVTAPEGQKIKYLHLWRRESVGKPWRLILEIANAATATAAPAPSKST